MCPSRWCRAKIRDQRSDKRDGLCDLWSLVTASVLSASAPMRRKHSCPKTRCCIAQRVPNEAMPLVMLRLKFYIRHRRELRLKAPGDAIGGIGKQLAVRGCSRHEERAHEAARSVFAIAVIQCHRITGKSKFTDAHGFLDAIP